jgi:hypothetical protein
MVHPVVLTECHVIPTCVPATTVRFPFVLLRERSVIDGAVVVMVVWEDVTTCVAVAVPVSPVTLLLHAAVAVYVYGLELVFVVKKWTLCPAVGPSERTPDVPSVPVYVTLQVSAPPEERVTQYSPPEEVDVDDGVRVTAGAVPAVATLTVRYLYAD